MYHRQCAGTGDGLILKEVDLCLYVFRGTPIVAKCPGTSGTVLEFFVLSPVLYGRCFCPGKIAIGLFSQGGDTPIDAVVRAATGLIGES